MIKIILGKKGKKRDQTFFELEIEDNIDPRIRLNAFESKFKIMFRCIEVSSIF